MGKWKHRLTNVDIGNKTANCSNCGEVKIKAPPSSSPRCYTAIYGSRAAAGKPNVCEICGKGGRICFDHCHTTGDFRGWLCSSCNSLLGFAYDDINILKNAISYLSK